MKYFFAAWLIVACFGALWWSWFRTFQKEREKLLGESRWREWFTHEDLVREGFTTARASALLLAMYEGNCVDARVTESIFVSEETKSLLAQKEVSLKTVRYYSYRVVSPRATSISCRSLSGVSRDHL